MNTSCSETEVPAHQDNVNKQRQRVFVEAVSTLLSSGLLDINQLLDWAI